MIALGVNLKTIMINGVSIGVLTGNSAGTGTNNKLMMLATE